MSDELRRSSASGNKEEGGGRIQMQNCNVIKSIFKHRVMEYIFTLLWFMVNNICRTGLERLYSDKQFMRQYQEK